VVAAALIVAGIVGLWLRSIRWGPADLDPGLVAVVPFENQTGDPSLDTIGKRIADGIVQGLSESGLAEGVATLSMMLMSGADGSPAANLHDPAAIHAIAASTGAGIVVSGAYELEGDELQVLAQITDAEKDELVYAVPLLNRLADAPDEAVEQTSDRILGVLAAHYDYFVPSPRVALPPTFEAYRELRAGLDCVRGESPIRAATALHHYRRAAELDSTFVTAHFRMVYLFYFSYRDYAAADSCVATISSRRNQLSPYFILWADHCNAAIRGDCYEALRTLRAMEALDPEDSYVQYWIAQFANRLVRSREALAALDRLEPAALRDPLIGRNALLHRAHAYYDLGQHERELETLRLLEEYFPGDEWTYGRNRFRVYAALGWLDEIHSAVDEFMTLPRHWLRRPGYDMEYAVIDLRARGYREDAARIADRAVAFYLDRPADEARMTAHRWQLADCLYVAERWEGARALYEELTAELPEELWFRGRLGTLAARRGDREEALRMLDELRRLDRPYQYGTHIRWCASIAAQLGDREQAVEFLREVLGQGGNHHYSGLYLHPCIDLEPLYGYEPYEELRRPKG
jgi:tetratricopeptide (TPR) repeat protein